MNFRNRLQDNIVLNVLGVEVFRTTVIKNTLVDSYCAVSNLGGLAIVGGEPLSINDIISLEGSMTFVTRPSPFVGKEEIDSFYDLDSKDFMKKLIKKFKIK